MVGGGLRGCDAMGRNAFGTKLEPGYEYMVVCLCLGTQPVAAQVGEE